MTLAHLCVLSVMNIYGNPDTSYNLPWFLKLSLIGLSIRACFWVLNKLPSQNSSPRKPTSKRTVLLPLTQQVAPTPEKAPPAAEILVFKNGQQLGPYALKKINSLLSTGTIMASDLGWHEGMVEWEPLASMAGVVVTPAHGLRPPPPPIDTTGSATVGGPSISS